MFCTEDFFSKQLLMFSLIVLCRDPIPVPEKVRKPLTQVEEFSLRLNERAVDRAEFDQRVSTL